MRFVFAAAAAATTLFAAAASAAPPAEPPPGGDKPKVAAPPAPTGNPAGPIAKPTEPDCRGDVQDAIAKQKKAGKFRMESNIITEQGPVKMTTEYIVPDRMRQIVTVVVNPKPVETVVVGNRGWINDGTGWKALDDATRLELVRRMDEAIGDMTPDVGGFFCRGTKTVDGREVKAYEAEEPGPKDLSPNKEAQKPRNEAARFVYVDAKTGLPERSVFARRESLDKPIFKSVYTYVDDIKIEPPADAKR